MARGRFTDNCVVDIRADRKHLAATMRRSLMLVTALAPKIGYDAGCRIAKSGSCKRHRSFATRRSKPELFLEMTLDRLVRPEKMIGDVRD